MVAQKSTQRVRSQWSVGPGAAADQAERAEDASLNQAKVLLLTCKKKEQNYLMVRVPDHEPLASLLKEPPG